MKVVQHTQDLLVLRPTGSGLFLALFGLVFLVVGLGMTFALGQKVYLACERQDRQVECQVRRTFLGLPVGTTTIGGVRGARVASKVDSEGLDAEEIAAATYNGR